MGLLRRLAAGAAAAALVLGGGPATAAPNLPETPSATVVSVQTYNMFSGADLTPLFGAQNPLIPASMMWARMQMSDIPGRAEAVAGVIAEQAPDLVGLQEVSTWRSAPATFSGGVVVPTGEWSTDYEVLDLLLADLAARGTPYELVVANTNFSNDALPLPVLTSRGLRLATLTDRDVILVKQSSLGPEAMTIAGTDVGTYEAKLLFTMAGTPVDVPRGWASADVTLRGQTFRFLDTHLEAYGSAPLKDDVRNPQAVELAAIIDASPYPVVVVGDVNARPTMCTDERLGAPEWPGDQDVAAYQTLLDAGLAEVWPTVYPYDPCGPAGWTSGQDPLDGAESTLDHRADDVFIGAGFTALAAEVVGDEDTDRTPGGLWASDHASTWAKVRLDTAATPQ
jgi:endonuclease/exonuclease/phosphatase family metal-dependent hydrolase